MREQSEKAKARKAIIASDELYIIWTFFWGFLCGGKNRKRKGR